MADTPIPEGLTEEVAEIYNAMEFDDLELQEMVMLAIAQGILAERAAQAERMVRLEEALRDGVRATTHALMVLPMPELGRHKRAWSSLVDWRDAARAALGGNADA